MGIVTRLLNSVVFWGAWIVIPVLMEIIPSVAGVILLLRRRRRQKGYPKPTIFPEISLIIPIYNSRDTLRACIESIHRSTYPNESIRIFLVNNHTPDDSFSVYAECQREFPELHMQWLDAEQGKSRALNLALYNSEGKYIINLDSDGLLERSALMNLVTKFEARPDLNCMTGAILTLPDHIRDYRTPFGRLLRELEFMEYAQAFLAGRSYASETNSVYTLSGAFSAFRKSAVLSSWMYNTDTICEDTHMTFQMRYRQGDQVEICEDAIFFVDPIESFNKLYTQRQRWQRGSLEVAQMFMDKNFKVSHVFTDVSVKTLLYDHTFAFPRMIWYLAMICLMCMNYSARVILFSTGMIFALYILIGYLYFLTSAVLLRFNPEVQRYYLSRWWCVALLPFFNFVVFFIRMAGIVNSISTASSWRTMDLTEEWGKFRRTLGAMLAKPVKALKALRRGANRSVPEAAPSEAAPYGPGWYAGVGVLFVLGALLAVAVFWSRRTFGVEINEIVTTLAGPLEGTGGGMIRAGVIGLGLPVLGVALLCVLGALLGRRAGRRLPRGARPYRAIHKTAFVLGVALLTGSVLYANRDYALLDYFINLGDQTALYEEHYVSPETVAITAGGETKNLIYIYIESMETTYASKEAGGRQEINYIPALTALAEENLNFSDNGGLGGFHCIRNTNWTMAALLATTSGIPYSLPTDVTIEDSGYFAGAVTLGDILAEHGYRQEFLCGSDGHFAGRKEYFETHGGYTVYDLYTAKEHGYSAGAQSSWGIEDKTLFDIAREEVTALAETGEPFNLTLLTVDLHAPDGYVCPWCSDEYDSVTGTVANCSDRLTGEFVDWCRQQDFFEDTVIVITGDHPRMDTNLVADVDFYDRTVYDCFIGSAAESVQDPESRTFTTMDVFPTTLAALGFSIEGDRLGLGVNLFSDQKTLAETRGAEWLGNEVGKASDYYMATFCTP